MRNIMRYLSIPMGLILISSFQNCSPPKAYVNSSLLLQGLSATDEGSVLPPDSSSSGTTQNFGTYYKPFTPASPWNSRPIDPVFATFEIPRDKYFPTIAAGAYSTGLFLAKSTDLPMTIYGKDARGVWDPDSGTFANVVIPRWPADVLPASGSDGHADILDPVTGIIHSFWVLKKVNGQWIAAQHAWSRIDGTGFGYPGHHYQGARAVGVVATAGIIRKHEIKDGNPIYKHALAMSLTYSGLSKNPTYVFPATSADTGAESQNYGAVPEGALLMLPSNFDTTKIANPDLRKVAETLKVYGAYVVDRNDGTPFVIYVENGSTWNLMPNGWDNTIASQLDQIRAGLRQVISATSWRDGNENRMVNLNQNFNAFSMRGPWSMTSTGTTPGVYDSVAQAVIFPNTPKQIIQQNTNGTGLFNVSWGKRLPGTKQRFTVKATGGALLRLDVWVGGSVTYSTGLIGDGVVKEFTWPTGGWITVTAASGVNQSSSVGAEMIMIP